jgi:hypothetical protein
MIPSTVPRHGSLLKNLISDQIGASSNDFSSMRDTSVATAGISFSM